MANYQMAAFIIRKLSAVQNYIDYLFSNIRVKVYIKDVNPYLYYIQLHTLSYIMFDEGSNNLNKLRSQLPYFAFDIIYGLCLTPF